MSTNNLEHLPLVSAISIIDTPNTHAISMCIKCFNAQTYKRKELVIINNANSQYEASELNIQASDNIKIIDTPSRLSAGMARNYGISAAKGQIIAQFDCDAIHAPHRLEAQITAMAKHGGHICVLSSVSVHSIISGEEGILSNAVNMIPNTMVFARPNNIDYPDIDKGEEYEFMKRMMGAGMRSVTLNSPELYYKIFICGDDDLYDDIDDHMHAILGRREPNPSEQSKL